jgi:ribonuclease P/MRP protein subunit POP1
VTFAAPADEGKPGSLQRYYATPGIARGFCSACGGFLFWQDEARAHISVCAGTLDKAVLREHGARLLANARHLWCADEIPGVTDHLSGDRWRYDNEGEDAQRM